MRALSSPCARCVGVRAMKITRNHCWHPRAKWRLRSLTGTPLERLLSPRRCSGNRPTPPDHTEAPRVKAP
eukprot:8116156-Pyramimonas_sp.AAC.1